ncbi:hypothetical protein Anas_01958 [Armadillidium nasatum]|uniref:Zinc finger protein n=1 Tax=Armadillidium nasatum TaxID=96803 RepID=A0A5N5TPH0_9CRUS|nr:hypothetical protein Anas_01958 [Armadillidium nasatum]
MSLEHQLPDEVPNELLEPMEPFYDVDEKEAEDINSCLNFLSILDDDDSTDSCNFTLFRKKDDKHKEIENNDKTCESVENKNNCNNNNNNNVSEASSSGEMVSANICANSVKPSASSAAFVNRNKSTILFPASKSDSSYIKGKNNIILKIPSVTLKSPPGQKNLLQSDKSNQSQNINCTEFKILKKIKLKNTSKAEVKPRNLPKSLKEIIESTKEGEIICRNQIILPSVSASRKPINPVKQSCTAKVLPTSASPNKYCAVENSKMICNERNSRVNSESQSPNTVSKILSDNDKTKTENGLISKYFDTASPNKDSKNSVMIPVFEAVNISKNSVEVPQAELENPVNIPKSSLEIPHSDFENSMNLSKKFESISTQPELETSLNIPEPSIEIPQLDDDETVSADENLDEDPQPIFDNTLNIPCQEFEQPAIIQENSVEIPDADLDNIVNLQENLISLSPPEFEGIVNTQKDNVSVPSYEPDKEINGTETLIQVPSSTSTTISFFNSFSSIEITKSSPQEKQKDTQELVNNNVKATKRRRNKKSEKTVSDKNRKTAEPKNKKTNKKTKKSKTVSKEMYKPLERMGLPTFLNYNNSVGKKESNEIKDPEASTQELLRIGTKELDFDKIGVSLDETSLTSSLNSDHTSDSLIILRDNYPDPNNKSGSSNMIDKLHNYCHSSRTVTNEQCLNSSNRLESKLACESISSGIVNDYSQNENVDQLFIQPLDNSQFSEDILFDNETLNVMNEPEIPSLNFNEISKTLVSNQEFNGEANSESEELGTCETSSTSKSEEKGESENKASFCYSFNKFSPLSFTIQNVLENMFKYETFPSSANMARLAKVLGIQWRDIRNWFVARRTLNKKNGIFLRNKSLTSCPWCPNATDIGNNKAIVHLLSKDHLYNMVPTIEKHDDIFSQVHHELCRNEEQTEILTGSEINKDETKEHNANKILIENKIKEKFVGKIIPTKTLKINEKHKDGRIDHMNINNEIRPLSMKDKANSKLPSKSPSLFENKTKIPDKSLGYFKAKDTSTLPVKGRESIIDRETLKADENIDLKDHYDSNFVIGYRCPDCMKIFSTEWLLIKHSLLHKKFICSECNEVFPKEEELKYHFKEHLIDSMDDDLYRYYVCFKCYNLNCICPQEMYRIPYFGGKHYIRPQKARRSKPFRSVPYSGVNEHLKVTLHDFWNKYKKKENSISSANESSKQCLNQDKCHTKSDSKNKKNISRPVYSAPTYTNITTFNCYLCESFFFTYDELEEHLTVHKIQANNKRRKKYQDENIKKKKIEDSRQSEPKSVCYYCNKSFQKHNILVKHLKFFCKSLPFVLKSKLKNGIHIEKVGRSNKFKLKNEQTLIENNSSSKPSATIKCKLCKEQFPSNQLNYHKSICIGHSNEKVSGLQTTNSVTNDEYLESNENDLYLCKFCNIPLESAKLIMLHIERSCSQAPSEVVSEVKGMDIEGDYTKYYNLIKRSDFHKILPIDKIERMLDVTSFLIDKKHKQRIKCKFCEKCPFKYWLKLHLTKHCKYVPKELHYVINRNSSRIFSSSKFNENKSPIDTNKLPDSTSKVNGNFNVDLTKKSVVENCKNKLQSITSETSDKTPSSSLFYDCHLCEEKFKISKDFITHMQNFHCMNISEKSCYKWLTKVDKICRDSNLEKIPTDNLFDQQQEDNLIAYDSISSEIIEEPVTENDLDKEVTIASVADDPSKEATIISLADETTNVSSIAQAVTPSKENFILRY